MHWNEKREMPVTLPHGFWSELSYLSSVFTSITPFTLILVISFRLWGIRLSALLSAEYGLNFCNLKWMEIVFQVAVTGNMVKVNPIRSLSVLHRSPFLTSKASPSNSVHCCDIALAERQHERTSFWMNKHNKFFWYLSWFLIFALRILSAHNLWRHLARPRARAH